MKHYFKEKNFTLYFNDCFEVLKTINKKSINMIFADPPYFISNGGTSCHSGKRVLVDKGDWDKYIPPVEKLKWNRKWIKLCKKVLNDNGTIWISGTHHNIYSIGLALELEGFSIINNITWQKPNPTPNLSCRCFTHSTETIIWARKIINNNKAKHFFNYNLMKKINNNRQMKDVWNIGLPKKNEKIYGKHPTQKPEELLERIVLSSTNENDVILDPFNGSGTTGIMAIKLNRKYIGIDSNIDNINLTIKRYKGLSNEK